MDLKNQFLQTSTRRTPTNAKKNQDASNSKNFPKSSNKRETSGTNNFSKFNQSAGRSNAQKTKNVDKRPKPKGCYFSNSKANSKVVENELAEFNSVMAPRNKKQNMNHLLNFHYTSREMQNGWNYNRTSGFNNKFYNRWLPPIQRHKYNKEQFLQANCQFVVTANGNYVQYLNDPDALIDWKLIQQIRIFSTDNMSCPICLCPPIAGKMTRCGHVYCWPCILHYLTLSEKTWSKCPICYEAVHKADLKSVVEITQKNFNAGDDVIFRLMRREKGSVLAVPVNEIQDVPPKTFLSISEIQKQQVYSKLILVDDNEIMDIIEAERAQLSVELLEDSYSLECEFVQQALDELVIREQQLIEANNGLKKCETEELADVSVDHNIENHLNKLDISNKLDAVDNESLQTADDQQKLDEKRFYYFYQAEEGQNVFLHAVNIKMLEMQYGNLENCPKIISGKLLEKEVGSLTEDLRRRMRYLCHLPVTCQFEIAEIELNTPMISEEVLEFFADQLTSREKKRQRREREERKREKKIAEEENKQMGRYPKANVHIESHLHFPEFTPENHASENSQSLESSLSSSPTTSALDEMAATNTSLNNNWSDQAGPSFAEMLRNPNAHTNNPWPSLHPKKPQVNAVDDPFIDEIDPETEEYIPPVYKQSLGDSLALALEKSKNMSQSNNNTIESNGKKKKKRAKSTVLFTTGMARGS